MAERARQWTDAQARGRGDRPRRGDEPADARRGRGDALRLATSTREAHDIAESLTVIIENFNQMLLPLWRYWRNLPLPQNLRLRAAQRTLDATHLPRSSRSGARMAATTATCSRCCSPPRTRRIRRKRLTDTEMRDQAHDAFSRRARDDRQRAGVDVAPARAAR